MEVQTSHLVGTWRHIHQNVFIDFTVWNSDGYHKAIFTIYEREPENKTNYEWHGQIEVVNTQDLPLIDISNIKFTENKSEYQTLTIWDVSEESITLQLESGDKLVFTRLHQTFERVF